MSSEEKSVLDLWQSQTTERFQMTPEEIRMRIEMMEKTLRRRTRGGYLVTVFLFVMFGIWLVVDGADPIFRLGALLLILAVVFFGYQIHQNRFREAPAGAVGSTASVDFLRRELTRQRDFHRGRLFWSRLLSIFPAGLVFLYGFARAHPEVLRTIQLEALLLVFFSLLAIPLNLWMSRKYQRQIDELDRNLGGVQ